jgi:hypothetical protein
MRYINKKNVMHLHLNAIVPDTKHRILANCIKMIRACVTGNRTDLNCEDFYSQHTMPVECVLS